MDVLNILFAVVVGGILLAVVLAIAFGAGVVVLWALLHFWPLLIGLAGAVVIWRSGHDNWAVLFFLAFLVVNIWWGFVGINWLDRPKAPPTKPRDRET